MKFLVLDDGITGNTTQSLGIVEALSQKYEVLPIKLKGPSYRLFNRKGSVKFASKILGLLVSVKLYNLSHIVLNAVSLNPIPTDKFDAIISAGSYLAPINLTLSKRLNAKSICIMTPENISLKNFDLIIVPSHDVIRYPRLKKLQNIFVTTCAPNCITPDKLKMGIKNISDRLDFSDTKVRIGILIGGNDQNYFIDRKWAERFLETLEKLASVKHFSYLISTSRRTPTDVVQFLIEKTTKPYFIYREFVGISSASNYFGILGICDILLVTEDSVTMISEACSTGKPVVVVGSGKRKKKLAFDTTIENLVRNNYCFYVPAKQLDRLPDTIIKSLEHNFSLLEDTQKCALKIAEILNIKKS